MFHHNKIQRVLLMASALTLSSVAVAQDCGEVPARPELVDGASSTMDQMVANSEAVKGYIADADAYLDCREAYIVTEEFQALEEGDQQAYRAANKTVLDSRNSISEDFNAEVSAYKEANP